MKARFVSQVIMSVLALGALTASGVAGGFTAKSSLAQTIPIATRWISDASLTSISSLEVNKDGSARWWIHAFYSLSKKRHLSITVKPGSIDTMEVGTGFTKPIGDKFIDSDKAIQEATTNGLKGNITMMGVNVLGTGSTAYWSVTGGYEEGDVSVILNANTGSFVRKEIIKGY